MKSVFATIGSEDISKAAYKLEMASKAGDEATCQAETEALCEAMLSFREKFLNTSFAAAESVEKEKVSADDLRRHLEVLEEACLFGKVGEIDAMTETLKRASLNEDVDAQLEEILRLLKSYDYETAAGQIEELLKGLSNFQEAGS
jgi:hypothetical protein